MKEDLKNSRIQEELSTSEIRFRRLFESAQDGILILDAITGSIISVNPYLANTLEYSQESFVGKKLWELGSFKDIAESKYSFRELQSEKYIRYDDLPLLTKTGKRKEFEFISNVYQEGDKKVIQCNIRDNSERKKAADREHLSRDALSQLNDSKSTTEIIHSILILIQDYSGLEAVGIRLKDGEDFPYYETKGFTEDFLQAERLLCEHDDLGRLVLDENGKPVLECMCGNVICGRTNPALPFFTRGGSFWSNCTTEFLTSPSARQARNRCNKDGYESVALIPLRSGNDIIGLLQFNDHRKNLFSSDIIQFFEGLGSAIGIALTRKLTENSLRESEIKFRTLFESSADGILVVENETMKLIYANPSICKMLGYSQIELNKMKMSDIHPKDQLEYVISKYESQVKGDIILAEDIPCLKKNGEILYVDVNATPAKIDGKECNVGFFRDITEKKKSIELLKRSEEKYKSLIENLNEGIWLIDKDNNTTFVNKKMAEMLGYTVDEMNGKSIFYFMDEAGKIISENNVEKRKINIKERHDFEFIRKDGSKLYALLETSSILDDKGHYAGSLAGVIDISKNKMLEAEKERIQNQLLQSQKMDSIGTLAGGIAHDFNNLLTIIKGYSGLAKAGIDNENPIYKDLDEVIKAADRAASLTRQMLLFSRKQSMNPINLNLNKVIENTLKMLERLIGENIKIKTNLQSDIWKIMADESRMEQIIMNLAVNAHDAMLKGGILTVKTENVTLDEEHSRSILESHSGRFVRLSIQDNGIGISNKIIARIFEPFFTTKGLGKGTGLGLSVVYGIVKQHNGWINVYSELGNGAIFKIYLPASLGNKETLIKEKTEYNDLKGHGEKILLIEDEEGIREYVTQALSLNGYKLSLAKNAKEALEIYEKEKGNFNLVISDVVLPDKPGPELVQMFMSDNPLLRVIFCSGYLDDKSQWELLQDKGYKFIQKPFDLNELLIVIKEILNVKKHE